MLLQLLKLEALVLTKYLTDKDILMAKIKITQKRSSIKRPQLQKRTLQALGLKKINHSVEHEANPQIEGMIRKVNHLIEVEKV